MSLTENPLNALLLISMALLLRSGGLPDRPHLDAAPLRRRNPRRDLDRVVQILGVDEVEPAQLLLGLGVGAVGGGQLAVADARGRGRLHRLQPLRRDPVAVLLHGLREGAVLGHPRFLLLLGQALPLLLVVVDQAQVPHGSLRVGVDRCRGHQIVARRGPKSTTISLWLRPGPPLAWRCGSAPLAAAPPRA